MAFLCPVRIRRNKKKGDLPPPPTFFNSTSGSASNAGGSTVSTSQIAPGRITGSSSIETLVRVGLEKEAGSSSMMQVLHDFSPCVDDELEVRRGDIVSLLYREHDWVYVIDSKTPPNEGFIPYTYVTALKTGSGDSKSTNTNVISPFPKVPSECLYLNLYNFTARDENDINLDRGALVTVLNVEDPDWYWIVRADGEEGFVPSSFLRKMSSNSSNQNNSNSNGVGGDHQSTTSHKESTREKSNPSIVGGTRTGSSSAGASVVSHKSHQSDSQNSNTNSNSNKQSGDGKGVELVMLYDYKGQAGDDLTVRRGDYIHADLSVQTVQGWLWAYAPKQKKYGFIPSAYAVPPAMTSL